MDEEFTPYFIMDIFITIIICLIICAIIGKICYDRGHDTKVQEVSYDNKAKELEYKSLCDKVQEQQRKSDELQQEYLKKQDIVNNANKTAETLLKEKTAIQDKQLQEKYERKSKELENNFSLMQQKYNEQIDNIQKELNQLSQTKAATIKAFQQEELIKEQKDQYRLDIGRNDLNDVEVLESVRPRLNKPRVLSMLIWQTFWQPLAKIKFPLILGDKQVCGIYKITNLKDEKCYIGQARDIRKRFNEHCKCGLGIDTPQGNKLYQAMQEDGLENFTFELLEECPEEELDNKEQFYIQTFNAVEYGYNGRYQK